MELIEGLRFGEERALYGKKGLVVKDCSFAGEEDGESALKESCDITVEKSRFDLRYPLWHARDVRVRGSEINESCRAPLWYSEDVSLLDTRLHGTKAVRECRGVHLDGCDVISEEFAWFSRDIVIENSRVEGAYFMLRSENVTLRDMQLHGKYSLQYIKNGSIERCTLDTKDSLWHAKGVTVKNSILRGEYLAWYSEDLTLIDCEIYGTQPFCYCKGLRLVNCRMHECDLAFEKSEVDARLLSPVLSIKNPLKGQITLPAVGEIIMDDPLAHGEIVLA